MEAFKLIGKTCMLVHSYSKLSASEIAASWSVRVSFRFCNLGPITFTVSSADIDRQITRHSRLPFVPCSFICLICFTVSFRIAHLSGLTLKLSISLKLANISSASSSMYLFSCSRLRFSLLRLGLEGHREHRGENERGGRHDNLGGQRWNVNVFMFTFMSECVQHDYSATMGEWMGRHQRCSTCYCQTSLHMAQETPHFHNYQMTVYNLDNKSLPWRRIRRGMRLGSFCTI